MTRIESTIHPEVEEALAPAREADRQWFIDHPEALVRLRPQFPDELAAIDAAVQTTGQPAALRIGATLHGKDLPLDWMAVVDMLRVAGVAPGSGGESARIKMACPAPEEEWMAQALEGWALGAARECLPPGWRPPHRPRPRGRGFA
ncbi:MAG: hypothetical protein VKM34_02900 [Cyanobacteriota bacterium]|nr:hypothetical protein [Cyanobacteriota bacterium]